MIHKTFCFDILNNVWIKFFFATAPTFDFNRVSSSNKLVERSAARFYLLLLLLNKESSTSCGNSSSVVTVSSELIWARRRNETYITMEHTELEFVISTKAVSVALLVPVEVTGTNPGAIDNTNIIKNQTTQNKYQWLLCHCSLSELLGLILVLLTMLTLQKIQTTQANTCGCYVSNDNRSY